MHTLEWFSLGDVNLQYKVGVDGISVLLILLSTLLMPLVFISAWDSIKERVRAYMAAFLILESLMIGTFAALDLFLFYLFFEAVLIPMFLIIGIWGGKDRVYASYKFFLYTLLGSVLMLIAMIAMTWLSGTTDIEALIADPSAFGHIQTFLWLAFFASFSCSFWIFSSSFQSLLFVLSSACWAQLPSPSLLMAFSILSLHAPV